MELYKIFFHCLAFFKKILLKIIYGRKINVGKHTTWRRRFDVMISKNAQILIGDCCFFNNDCSLNSMNFISIGSGSIFGENVKIYDHNHRFNGIDNLKKQGYSIGKVIIGDNCWIGSNVVILKDSVIGDNCVIGAGTVVSGIIESNCIVRNRDNYYLEKIRRQ